MFILRNFLEVFGNMKLNEKLKNFKEGLENFNEVFGNVMKVHGILVILVHLEEFLTFPGNFLVKLKVSLSLVS